MARSLKKVLDEGNLNKFQSASRDAQLGKLLSLIPKFGIFAASSNTIALPDNAKAAAILRCYSTAGTTTGYLTPTDLATPTTGLVGISATGNILFAAADAVTAAEVLYLTHEGEVWEDQIAVASNSGTLLGAREGFLLLSATQLAGTRTGTTTVVARAATPTTGQACLGVTGKTVTFAAADAVTSALVKYVRLPAVPVATAMLTEDKNY